MQGSRTNCEQVLRALRVKENYITGHRKHIDQQVSVDVTIQKLINLKDELVKYYEEWELIHMRYELLVSDDELTDVCDRAYAFRREVSDHIQRLTDLIEVKQNLNPFFDNRGIDLNESKQSNQSNSSVCASTVTGPQFNQNRSISEYVKDLEETSYLINPLESLTNSFINNTISLSNSNTVRNVRFDESNVNARLGVGAPGVCAPPPGLEPFRFSTPYPNPSNLTYANFNQNLNQNTTRGHVRNVINNIQGVVNDSTFIPNNIPGVQNNFGVLN